MRIEIPGKPLPQARMRLYMRGNRSLCFDPQGRDKVLIKRHIKAYIQEHYPDYQFPKCPQINFTFYMPIPKFTSKKVRKDAEIGNLRHIQKPDVDNLIKLYMDCLNDIAVHDDAQVCAITAAKFYHSEPRVIIEITDHPQIVNSQGSSQDSVACFL